MKPTSNCEIPNTFMSRMCLRLHAHVCKAWLNMRASDSLSLKFILFLLGHVLQFGNRGSSTTCAQHHPRLLRPFSLSSLSIYETDLEGNDCGSVVCLQSKQWLTEAWTSLIRSRLSDWPSTPSLFRRPDRRVTTPHPPPPPFHYSHNFML